MSEYVEYLYELADQCEMQDSLQEAFEIDKETARQAMLEWAKELVKRYKPKDKDVEPKKIAFCHKCSNKMIQPNLFDESIEIVGCSLLTTTKWNEGMNDGNQTNCPV